MMMGYAKKKRTSFNSKKMHLVYGYKFKYDLRDTYR